MSKPRPHPASKQNSSRTQAKSSRTKASASSRTAKAPATASARVRTPALLDPSEVARSRALCAESRENRATRRRLLDQIKQESAAVRQACEVFYRNMQARREADDVVLETLRLEMARRQLFEDELQSRARSLQSLSMNLMFMEQRDRKRFADALHDDVLQMLAAVKFRLASLRTAEIAPGTAAQVEDLLNQCLATTRSLMSHISPPMLDGDNLGVGLRGLGRWVEDTHGLKVQLTGGANGSENETIRLLLLHAVRELLQNIVRHAETQSAHIAVTYTDDSIRVTVTDNGRGFEPPSACESSAMNSLGAIRQRLETLGGRMEIASTPGAGCRILLEAPRKWATV